MKKYKAGWLAHDRLVFYETTGLKKSEWQGDGSLSSVQFGWPTLVINGRRLIEIGATGQAKVIRNDVVRARQILYADNKRHILCQKTKVSVTQIDEPDTSAGCESSEGWRFEGVWLENEPIVCGGKIIEFSAAFGEWRHWVKLNVRNLSTGAIVASVKARGTQSICLLERIVETASGRSWSAVDGHPMPSLPCSGKPLLWAASHDSAWCLDSTGKIEQLSAQQR